MSEWRAAEVSGLTYRDAGLQKLDSSGENSRTKFSAKQLHKEINLIICSTVQHFGVVGMG